MIQLGIFIGLLLLLYFIAGFCTLLFSRVLFRIFNNNSFGIYLFSFFLFPGVLIHELSHALMAVILRVPVGKMEFVPQMRDGVLKLGSVQVGKVDPLRTLFVGVAPLIVGTIILISTLYFVSSLSFSVSTVAFLIFVIFEISNTMFSSKKDLEGTGGLFVVLIIAVFFIWFFNLTDNVIRFISPIVAPFTSAITQGSWYVLLIGGVQLGMIIILVVIEQIVRRVWRN